MVNIDVEGLKGNLFEYLDLVIEHNEIITVHSNKDSAVILSEKEYKRVVKILNNTAYET